MQVYERIDKEEANKKKPPPMTDDEYQQYLIYQSSSKEERSELKSKIRKEENIPSYVLAEYGFGKDYSLKKSRGTSRSW